MLFYYQKVLGYIKARDKGAEESPEEFTYEKVKEQLANEDKEWRKGAAFSIGLFPSPQANELLEQALADEVPMIKVNALMGLTGEYDDGVRELVEGLEDDPDQDVNQWVILAKHRLDGGDPIAMILKAEFKELFSHGEYHSATHVIEDYGQFYQESDDDKVMPIYFGYTLMRLGKVDEAKTRFESGLEKYEERFSVPNKDEVFMGLAICHVLMDESEMGLEYYEKLSDDYPQELLAFKRALTYSFMGDLENAKEHAQFCLDKTENEHHQDVCAELIKSISERMSDERCAEFKAKLLDARKNNEDFSKLDRSRSSLDEIYATIDKLEEKDDRDLVAFYFGEFVLDRQGGWWKWNDDLEESSIVVPDLDGTEIELYPFRLVASAIEKKEDEFEGQYERVDAHTDGGHKIWMAW